jgi:hypothetical protein
MPHFDQTNAQCLIFTEKEGLLSAVAHDLKIAVTRFEIDVDAGNNVNAFFEAGSVRVVCAMAHGNEEPGRLSESDRRTIDDAIATEILQARRHPHIHFTGSVVTSGNLYRVNGTLNVRGSSRPMELVAGVAGSRIVTEHRLNQPDFGIRPYRAMLGTLRVKPDVLIRLILPHPG